MQNVNLLSAKEQRGLTVVAFSRDIETCDAQDRTIEVGSMNLIWTYHSRDPVSTDYIFIHEKTGWRRVNLLSQDGATNDDDFDNVPEDVQSVDLVTNQVSHKPRVHSA
jgi:hypothetical protein